jgi:antirestriction protein ArdC
MPEDRFTRRDVYELVTSRILASLEKGVVPWHRPWTSQPPSNLVTKKAYRGVNVFLLSPGIPLRLVEGPCYLAEGRTNLR